MQDHSSLTHFILHIPKAELHLHIEGTLEPELMFALAKRNNITLPFSSVAEVQRAYNFHNLQSFLDIYYQGARVLLYEQDFYDLTYAYLTKMHQEHVRHVEIFFDPQTHTERGISFDIVIAGIHRALTDAATIYGITSKLIMCFLRHLSEASAQDTLSQALRYRNWIYGVGLDSSEVGNPPSKFARVFEQARIAGFVPVAHAGEEGPAAYIHEAMNLLHVARIDHGNRCLDDTTLVDTLVQKQLPLTICPLSNKKLQVVPDLTTHPLLSMIQRGLLVTINSDDPAYFGGYLTQNYVAIASALQLTKEQIVQLAKNSFLASFLSDSEKQQHIEDIDAYIASCS